MLNLGEGNRIAAAGRGSCLGAGEVDGDGRRQPGKIKRIEIRSAFTADDCIIAETIGEKERVLVITAKGLIIARSAEYLIIATAAVKAVIAGPADQRILALFAFQRGLDFGIFEDRNPNAMFFFTVMCG